MAQLHFADPLPNYQPPPSTQPASASPPHSEPFAPQQLRPVHDLFSMLKGVFNAMLDLAPALVADLSHSASAPPLSSYASSPPQSQQPSPQPPYVTVSSSTVSTSIVPLGPSDHSHRSCVDFLRRLLGAGGATELRINSLPVRSLCIEDGVDKLAYEQDMCAICLDGYEHHNRVRVLGCQHVFHTACIDPWLRRGRPTCPLCQTVCC